MCERVNYNDYKLDIEIYIQMLINLHRIEPKPQKVDIICLNVLVLVKMTESKVLFVTASGTWIKPKRHVFLNNVLCSSLLLFYVTSQDHKRLLILTFTLHYICICSRIKQVTCNKNRPCMIYAKQMSNSNFFQPSWLTRHSTPLSTCIRTKNRMVTQPKANDSLKEAGCGLKPSVWHGFMRLKRWRRARRAEPGRWLLLSCEWREWVSYHYYNHQYHYASQYKHFRSWIVT